MGQVEDSISEYPFFLLLFDRSHSQVARHLKKLKIWLDVFWDI